MLQVWESISRYLVWNQKKKKKLAQDYSLNHYIDDGSMIFLKTDDFCVKMNKFDRNWPDFGPISVANNDFHD